MKHINIAMEKLDLSSTVKNEENIPLVERILRKTQNPKIAAVLALDLILVGVDTVRCQFTLICQTSKAEYRAGGGEGGIRAENTPKRCERKYK